MKKKLLCIYGSQGVGRECLEIAKEVNRKENKWNNIIFVDDINYDIYINECEVHNFRYVKEKYTPDECEFVICVGEPKVRKILAEKVTAEKYKITELYYTDYEKHNTVSIGCGTIISYNSILTCNVEIGDNCYINKNCVISHDVKVGNCSVFASGVLVGGFSKIGNMSYVGVGAVISDRINIGNNCIIGAGAVVINDVADNSVVVGNPARFLRENTTGKVFK